MEKIDFKRELSDFYRASSKVVVEVDVPPFRFLMIDGKGDPGSSPEYARAVEALFSVSYTTKFAVKKGPMGIDYGVMPLEGLWWADDWSVFTTNDRSQWQWTMMIMQPDLIPEELILESVETVFRKKALPTVKELRLETFHEGRSAQIMHVGPFSEEGPTVEKVHEFIDGQSSRRGKHHEIYLSDVRRADPKKWKTIIRQPMA